MARPKTLSEPSPPITLDPPPGFFPTEYLDPPATKGPSIKRIRLTTAYPFGPAAIVETSIAHDSSLAYGVKEPPIITFDVDPRFINVRIGNWVDLIPLTNVAGILLDPVL